MKALTRIISKTCLVASAIGLVTAATTSPASASIKLPLGCSVNANDHSITGAFYYTPDQATQKDHVYRYEYMLTGSGTGGKSDVLITVGPYYNRHTADDLVNDMLYVVENRAGLPIDIPFSSTQRGAYLASFDTFGSDPQCTARTQAF